MEDVPEDVGAWGGRGVGDVEVYEEDVRVDYDDRGYDDVERIDERVDDRVDDSYQEEIVEERYDDY